MLETDIEIGDLLRDGILSGGEMSHFIALKVNPIVNRLLQLYGESPLPAHGKGYEVARQMRAAKPEVMEILNYFRELENAGKKDDQADT